jgi:DNA-binding LacI/PurR family transcriptional regulator
VIFLGQGDLHEAFNQLAATDARFVVWGAQLPGQKYCSIGSDNFLGGRRATLTWRAWAASASCSWARPTPRPCNAAKAIWTPCARAAWSPSRHWCCPSISRWNPPRPPSGRLLRRGATFDAIFASSDLIALGAIRALQRAGLKVPEDVSVVGYDDMLLSRLSTPALSTIKQDTYKAGRLLVSRILDEDGDHRPERLPTDLIVRESCGA